MSEERGQTLVAGDDGTPEGVYVYCIIESGDAKTFGHIGIGGRGDEVFTVRYRDLAAVVSRAPLLVYDPTRENALTHEHVQEIVMNEHGFTPVPMSFGTLFKTDNDTIEFLKDTYEALRDVLQKMKDKLRARDLRRPAGRRHRVAREQGHRRQDDHECRLPRRPGPGRAVRREGARDRQAVRGQALVPLHRPVAAVQLRHDPAAARAFGTAGLLGRRPLAPRLVRPLPESEEPSRTRFKPLRSAKATTK